MSLYEMLDQENPKPSAYHHFINLMNHFFKPSNDGHSPLWFVRLTSYLISIPIKPTVHAAAVELHIHTDWLADTFWSLHLLLLQPHKCITSSLECQLRGAKMRVGTAGERKAGAYCRSEYLFSTRMARREVGHIDHPLIFDHRPETCAGLMPRYLRPRDGVVHGAHAIIFDCGFAIARGMLPCCHCGSWC